jgi:F-type H+-transporting ATPase subunit delta
MASIAIRYARAFADVIGDLKLDPNQIRDELRTLLEIVGESVALRRVLEGPSVSQQEKLRLLDALSQRAGFQPAVRNFMAVLMAHGHVGALGSVVRQFEMEMDQRLGFVEADITSVRELSAAERTALEGQIAQLTGRKVRARYSDDKSLLGGAVVKVGSTIYDGSLRGQLRRMKQQLSAG